VRRPTAIALFWALWQAPALAASSAPIVFLCSWENRTPIEITVDPQTMTASRNDGGLPYEVLKITAWGVWLEVFEPDNVAGMAVQMIERRDYEGADASLPGKWVDVVIAITGAVTPIDGGQCWQRR
jgi:hypothetical protein